MALRCRQCQAEDLQDLGPIPPSDTFAGQHLSPPWDGGVLYQCRRCHLAFRHPIRSEAEYEDLYARASEKIWVADALRTDQKHVLACIAAACPAGKVLDVGCYDGTLLGALAPSYERYGLEASAAAAESARQRGVEIVASRIRDLPSIPLQFDVISAVDVIEHVESPLSFVSMLADRLKPGGSLIISTGTLDAPAWRFVGGLYWYCSYPEHISFITQAWAQEAGARLGLTLAHARRFAYGDPDARGLGRTRRRFYRKFLVAKWREKLRLWWDGASAQPDPLRSQGYPSLFEDHMIVCLKKAQA